MSFIWSVFRYFMKLNWNEDVSCCLFNLIHNLILNIKTFSLQIDIFYTTKKLMWDEQERRWHFQLFRAKLYSWEWIISCICFEYVNILYIFFFPFRHSTCTYWIAKGMASWGLFTNPGKYSEVGWKSHSWEDTLENGILSFWTKLND